MLSKDKINFFKKIFLLILSLILIAGFTFRLFYPAASIFMIPDFGESDVLNLNLPLKETLSRSLKSHSWPLWTPFLAGGYPLLAEGQIGTFYLPNLVLFRFLPTIYAYNIILVINLLLCGIGTYLFLRQLKIHYFASFYGSLVFTFSGLLAVHLNHFNLLETATLMPLVFYTSERLRQKQNFVNMVFFSFIVSQQIFAGYVYLSFITLFGIFLYILGQIVINKKNYLGIFRQIAFFIMGLALSISLAAIQILPTLELLGVSERSGGLGFDTVTSYPFPVKNLISFVMPYFFGNPANATYPPYSTDWGIFWENTIYIGILPCVMGLLSIVFIKHKPMRIFWFIVTLSLLLVLGKYSPLYFVFTFFPFNLFRVTSRYLLLFTFFLCVLSAYFMHYFYGHFRSSRIFRSRISTYLAVALLIMFMVIDEYKFSYNYPPVSPYRSWVDTPQTVNFLANKSGRITSVAAAHPWNMIFLKKGWKDITPYIFLRNIVYPNYNMIFSLPHALINTGGLVPRRQNLVKAIELDSDLNIDTNEAKLSTASSNMYSITGVKYLISSFEIKQPNIVNIFTLNPPPGNPNLSHLYVHENKKAKERSYISFNPVMVSTLEEVKDMLTDNDFLSKNTALIENKKLLISDTEPVNYNIRTVSDKNDRLEFATESPKDGIFVLSDTYYPGWKAAIDNKNVPIERANLNFRALYLPKGKHVIDFIYEPLPFYTGKNITIITSLAVFCGILFSGILKKRHKRS